MCRSFVIDAGMMIVSEILFKECKNSIVVHGIGVYFDRSFCILEHLFEEHILIGQTNLEIYIWCLESMCM